MSDALSMTQWENLFRERVLNSESRTDPAHDLQHIQRVVNCAKQLCVVEKARMEVVIPAAWLHDFINIPKNDPRRAQASRISSQAALQFLLEIGYPKNFHKEIAHSIEAHSFSANLPCETVEARIVQDADRLDALGAIGIARCFVTAGKLSRALYHSADPFCHSRLPNDSVFTLDHFYQKLIPLVESLKTEAGRREGQKRCLTLKRFLRDLEEEIQPQLPV